MDRIKETTKNVLCTCIKGYQYFISPLMAPRCRFYPSCSTYALTALEVHGLKGIVLTIKRVLRCHPLHKGGYDPVPQEVKK